MREPYRTSRLTSSDLVLIVVEGAHQLLEHELAAHKLPEVEALIERAQAMRTWLLAATDCSCTSLDVCALFEPQSSAAETQAVAAASSATG
jgi:hypothetical protein